MVAERKQTEAGFVDWLDEKGEKKKGERKEALGHQSGQFNFLYFQQMIKLNVNST
jgi:hypothetical protein